MKKVLIGLLSLFVMGTASAQNSPKKSKIKTLLTAENTSNLVYTFTAETAAYTPLTGTTSINNNTPWDDPTFTFPMPFVMRIQGQLIDTLMLDGLGGSLIGSSNGNPIFGVMAPFETDLIDRGYDSTISLSPLSYKVDGAAGSRILKIEWKEVGSYGEYSNTGGILNMFISFQAWVYEGSNIIEYRYGPNTINDFATFYEGDPGPLVGTALTDGNASIVANLISGPVSSPLFSLSLLPLFGTPANGTLYRLTPIGGSSSVNESQLSSLMNIWPNPVNDIVNLELKNEQQAVISLYNMQGQKLKQQLLTENRSSLDWSDLPAGAYLIRMEGQAGSLRIIKR